MISLRQYTLYNIKVWRVKKAIIQLKPKESGNSPLNKWKKPCEKKSSIENLLLSNSSLPVSDKDAKILTIIRDSIKYMKVNMGSYIEP